MLIRMYKELCGYLPESRAFKKKAVSSFMKVSEIVVKLRALLYDAVFRYDRCVLFIMDNAQYCGTANVFTLSPHRTAVNVSEESSDVSWLFLDMPSNFRMVLFCTEGSPIIKHARMLRGLETIGIGYSKDRVVVGAGESGAWS